MRSICLFLTLFSFGALNAQQNAIIPLPVQMTAPAKAGNFVITAKTPLVLEGSGLENTAAFLNDYLQQYYGFKLKTVTQTNAKNSITLNLERMDKEIPGAYTMNTDKAGVYIAGDNAEGVFYGIQTLIQLLPLPAAGTLSVPYTSITDYPRFAYRGLHLDACRHFFPVSYVKKYIDYIALHKMNYFHWH